MLNRRGVKAGLGRVHAHLLRHAFAHAWLSEGGNEGDFMRLAGWRTREMPATRHREPICGREKPIAGYHWAITSKYVFDIPSHRAVVQGFGPGGRDSRFNINPIIAHLTNAS